METNITMESAKNKPTRVCADSSHCSSPGVPQSIDCFFAIRNKDGSIRYDSVCKKCRMRKQAERRRTKRSVHTGLWADAILRGLKQEYGKQSVSLDNRLTAEVLVAVMDLQKHACAVTGEHIILPTDDDLKITAYTDWRRSLSDMDRLRLPRLVSVFPSEPIRIGTCLFIIEGIYGLYQLVGIQGIAGITSKAPMIYQYDAILKHINTEKDDTTDTSVC